MLALAVKERESEVKCDIRRAVAGLLSTNIYIWERCKRCSPQWRKYWRNWYGRTSRETKKIQILEVAGIRWHKWWIVLTCATDILVRCICHKWIMTVQSYPMIKYSSCHSNNYRRGDAKVCSNHQWISLWNKEYKINVQVNVQLLNIITDAVILKTSKFVGFIFWLAHITEKCNTECLYQLNFIYLLSAFDTVSWPNLR